MHTPNPSQQKAFSLNILKFECAEQLDIQKFKFVINEGDDPLKDGRIVFGVRVDNALQGWVCLGFVHLFLDVHYFFEDIVDVCFYVFDWVEEDVQLFFSEYKNKYLYSSNPNS